jgi:hypothetical protein
MGTAHADRDDTLFQLFRIHRDRAFAHISLIFGASPPESRCSLPARPHGTILARDTCLDAPLRASPHR